MLAIVTGVLGGIGRATAEAFRLADWSVIGIDRRTPSEGVDLDLDLNLDTFWQIDIATDDADVELAVRFASVGPINALVNNAALQVNRTLIETDLADWDTVMATNVRGPYLTIKHAYDGLRAARGAVVNVSSVHSLSTSPGLAAYAASKGALTALTRAAALELGPLGIRVNAVLPGAVDTPMLRHGLARMTAEGVTNDPVAELAARIPLARVGEASEIAQAILFLADPGRSSYITGQTLVVDGGALARLSSE
jgi:NAD(P)-dependent dehydrogenase (short-subunit alcohol dehydrogenase family)